MSAPKASARQLKQGDNEQPSPSRSNLPKIIQHTSYTGRNPDAHARKGSGATDGTRTEAAWAEMQNTLEEVELSASGGASAFSAEHARALEELRKAQISLAQAWARSEAEDDAGDHTLSHSAEEKSRDALASSRVLGNEQNRTGQDGKARDRTDSSGSAGVSLEEETTNDIMLARKRREANDRYFEKVNKGVADVVEKLDIVAEKMKGVELEAQDLWESRSSLDTEGPS